MTEQNDAVVDGERLKMDAVADAYARWRATCDARDAEIGALLTRALEAREAANQREAQR